MEAGIREELTASRQRVRSKISVVQDSRPGENMRKLTGGGKMEKDRLGAFIDAVLAIIMTLLVLELPRPVTYDLSGLWELRANFFSYALSFFWLGAMWVNIHQSYHGVGRITQKTVWSAIIMLFFSSFFPYATKLIADEFMNRTMQGLYEIVVLLITFSVMGYYKQLGSAGESHLDRLLLHRQRWIWVDIAIKMIGLLLSVTVFPPAAIIAVLVTLLCIVIPNQFKDQTGRKLP